MWNVFCDWHIELIKPVLGGSDAAAAAETRKVAAFVDQILILLHPFMPFAAEELWDKTGAQGRRAGNMLIDARWPSAEGSAMRLRQERSSWVIKLISEIRSVPERRWRNVPAGARIPCVLVRATPEARSRAEAWATEITRLARLDRVEFSDAPAPGRREIVEGAIAMLPLSASSMSRPSTRASARSSTRRRRTWRQSPAGSTAASSPRRPRR